MRGILIDVLTGAGCGARIDVELALGLVRLELCAGASARETWRQGRARHVIRPRSVTWMGARSGQDVLSDITSSRTAGEHGPQWRGRTRVCDLGYEVLHQAHHQGARSDRFPRRELYRNQKNTTTHTTRHQAGFAGGVQVRYRRLIAARTLWVAPVIMMSTSSARWVLEMASWSPQGTIWWPWQSPILNCPTDTTFWSGYVSSSNSPWDTTNGGVGAQRVGGV